MSETLTKYRVNMTISGSICKPSYDGFVNVYAEDEEQAFERAIAESRRTAHWDSPPSAFRLDSIEVIQ